MVELLINKITFMVFTLDEIRNYLKTCGDLMEAIGGLSEHNITICNNYPTSFNYEKNENNLEKYETQIGLKKLKDEQLSICRNSNGSKGKYWMALSPKWIDKGTNERKTDFEIMYWVNYGDNKTYGWFTVEQIKEWLTNPDLKLAQLKQ